MLIKKIVYLLLTVLMFSSLFLLVNAIPDELGNDITGINIYQYKAGSNELIFSITDLNYVENMTIDVENGYDFRFIGSTILNSTQYSYSDIQYTQALAIQFFQNESYINPFSIQFPVQPEEDGYWLISQVTPFIEYSISDNALCNITHWINYNNGSGWLLMQDRIFNLAEISDSSYEPFVPETDVFDLRFIYFWGFVLTLILSPLLISGSIKFLSIKLFILGLVFAILAIGFYMMLAG